MIVAKGNTTIKEIAREAGVSATTVSSVLNNGKIIVGAAARKRILDAVQRLGYRPSRKARQLRKRSNQTIAFQIDSRIAVDEMWRPTVLLSLLMYQGACAYASSKGYSVNLLIPHMGGDMKEIESRVLNEDIVDGVILNGWKSLNGQEVDGILDRLKKFNVPVATFDHRIHEKGYPIVSLDLRPAVRKACARLKELGHERVSYIGLTGMLHPHVATQRFKIISEEAAAAGIELPLELRLGAETPVDSYRRTVQLLKMPGKRPSCVIYSGDHMALEGMKAIAEAGLNIPGDISVIGIDNAPYAMNAPVPLTTMDQKHFEQGAMIAKLLLDRIENPGAPAPSQCVLNADFIERGSLGYAKRK